MAKNNRNYLPTIITSVDTGPSTSHLLSPANLNLKTPLYQQVQSPPPVSKPLWDRALLKPVRVIDKDLLEAESTYREVCDPKEKIVLQVGIAKC